MPAGIRGPGVNQALLYNSAVYATPTWVEISIAVDVMLGLTKTMAEVKARNSNWIMNLPAMRSADLEWNMISDTSHAAYNFLRDAFGSDTLVDLAVCDDTGVAVSGADYFRADYYLDGFAVDQKLESAQDVKVTAKLAYSSVHIPAWTDVA